MTTKTELVRATTDDKTTIPSWLDLDVLCPPEVRTRLNAAADQLERALTDPQLIDAVWASYEAVTAYNDLPFGPGSVDGNMGPLYDQIADAIGLTWLWGAAHHVSELGGIARAERADFYEEAPERFTLRQALHDAPQADDKDAPAPLEPLTITESNTPCDGCNTLLAPGRRYW